MSQKTVEIYSTPTCKYCELAKEFFEDNDIKYTEYNVLDDMTQRHKMIQMSGQKSVPVIRIGDDVLTGFNPYAVKTFLGI